jgi:hypothetical protein
MRIPGFQSVTRFRASSALRILLLGSNDGECYGHVREISEQGLGLTVDRKLRIGGMLKTVVGGRLLIGIVRHCKRRLCSYSADVALLHSATKSECERLLNEWDQTLS